MMDRGKIASFVCAEKLFATEWNNDNPEHRANKYAADLLLPEFMFVPRAKNREMTFETVRELATQFQTSLTATTIRLVELGSYPAMVVCSERARRIWFKKDQMFLNACPLGTNLGLTPLLMTYYVVAQALAVRLT